MINLSLREYFIGQALVGVATSGAYGVDAAKKAVSLADQVIAVLDAEPRPPRGDDGGTITVGEDLDNRSLG